MTESRSALQGEHLYHFELLCWNRRVGYDDNVFEEGVEGGGGGGGVGGEVEVAVKERVEEEGGLEGVAELLLQRGGEGWMGWGGRCENGGAWGSLFRTWTVRERWWRWRGLLMPPRCMMTKEPLELHTKNVRDALCRHHCC
jgi:hypothetical protein